jgi:hypothetical protein
MEKARRRFANLQEELRNVHPSNERKYTVNIDEIFNEILVNYSIIKCDFIGDPKPDNSGI